MDGLTRQAQSFRLRLGALARRARWIALAVALACATPAFAQQQPKPVMENVFYNVVWGSATGALLGSAAAVIAAKDKNNPTGLRSGVFQGATAGGIIGLGVGVWLVFSGISFDPNGSTITDGVPVPGALDALQVAQLTPSLPLISLETSPTQPSRITGFKALVVDLRF